MAEREGFEPPDPEGSTVFKTAAFDRSATSPGFSVRHLPFLAQLGHLHKPQFYHCGYGLGALQKITLCRIARSVNSIVL